MGESELILSQLLREDTPPKDEPDYSDRLLQALLRQAALTGRYAASGVGGMGAAFANPLAYGANKGLEAVGSDYRFPEQHGALMGALTDMGVPEPEGALEKGVGFASEIGVPDPTDSAKLVSSLSHMIDPNWAMTVFHGSPHKWDYPDLSKVGTGEGAQAYGWGLYAAEKKDTGRTYANALSNGPIVVPDVVTFKGKEYPVGYADWRSKKGLRSVKDLAIRKFALHEGNLESAMEGAGRDVRKWLSENGKDLTYVPQHQKDAGHLYELDLPDETIEKMLDWDKPLSEQPESVRKAVDSLVKEHGPAVRDNIGRILERADEAADVPGSSLYKTVAGVFGGDQAKASQYLNSFGIPGIKYLDGTSRSKGEGTRNFVVFNEKYVKPLKRDGKPIKEK